MQKNNKPLKICFAASSGGHLEEISCLRAIGQEHESFLVTEAGGHNEVKLGQKAYYMRQINRKESLFIFHFITLFFKAIRIIVKEKPDCIISTGALVTVPFCVVGKIMGKDIIYIESFARVDKPSLTGKLMYQVAGLFIVQWNELLQYYPKAKFTGGIF